MSDGKHIARNAAWLVVATTLNKFIAFGAFVLVARTVGPQVTGIYFYAVSITSIFVILADLGMTPVVIRAIAGGREDGGRLLTASLKLKAMLAPIAVLVSLGYGMVNGADALTLSTIAVACLVMSADTFHLALYGALRGKQNLKPEAMGMLAGQVLTAIVSISAALLGLGPVGLACGLLIGSVWNVIWALSRTKRFGISFNAPSFEDFRRLLTEAVPFALAGISVKLYSYVDSLLIKAYHGTQAVGMYAVSYKMTYALQFVPMTFSAALYPALASAWARHDRDGLRRSFVGSLRFTAAIGFPLSAGLSALAPRIIPFVYGKAYLGSVASFEVLPWVLLPIFMDFPIGALLNATNRAYLKTAAMVGTMLVNVFLNALLVPSMGTVGAAWAGVFSFWILFAIGLYFTRKDAGRWISVLWILARACFAAAVSWAAWRLVGMHLPLMAAALFGGAVAFLAAFLLKLITSQDLAWLWRTMSRKPVPEDDVHGEL